MESTSKPKRKETTDVSKETGLYAVQLFYGLLSTNKWFDDSDFIPVINAYNYVRSKYDLIEDSINKAKLSVYIYSFAHRIQCASIEFGAFINNIGGSINNREFEEIVEFGIECYPNNYALLYLYSDYLVRQRNAFQNDTILDKSKECIDTCVQIIKENEPDLRKYNPKKKDRYFVNVKEEYTSESDTIKMVILCKRSNDYKIRKIKENCIIL